MAPTLSPQEFVQKWRNVDLKEMSAYTDHFNDLCRLVGHPTPVEDDPAGTRFTFQAGASKQSGGQGWADVWKKDYFAVEYKGKHANLAKAYDQLLQYRESLLNPPLLIVSDLTRIVIHTNFTNTVKQIHELSFDDLLTPAGLQRLRDVFYAPESFRTAITREQVTKQAAEEFADLTDHLRKWHHDPTEIAHFLIRLLFCLFAEDVGLLPAGLFSRLVQQTRRNVKAFTGQLKHLFAAMSTGGWFGADEILHFNGRLFDNDHVLPLDSDALDILLKVSKLDWSAIEPAIFGTLFEGSLDPAKRSKLGAEYTRKADILLVTEPVLMAPLRRTWNNVQMDIRALADQRVQASKTAQRTKITNHMQGLITDFANEIAQLRVLDPACGSGNFLYVALKQLLDLEKEVITFAGDQGLTQRLPQVSPEQLHGIEIDEYAYELAQITVWIGYIQWLRDNGFGRPAEPFLKPLDTIKHMDAILSVGDNRQAFAPAWPAADIILGNPPFLGGNRVRQELGDTYVDQLFTLYEGRVPAFADLVCYWFERARFLVAEGQVQRVGLLATNSIRGGANRRVLERIKATGDIFMAWADREWDLNGAAVRVSMVGFDNGTETERMLDGGAVATINPDLTSSLDITQAKTLRENRDICLRPDEKGGPFEISNELAQAMLAAPINVNSRPNTDVIRPWINGADIVRRPRSMWVIDFGTTMSLAAAAAYEGPFKYIEQHVKPVRATNSIERVRTQWWIHRIPGEDMRQALSTLDRFIATARVSKYRLFAWFPKNVLADSATYVFARDDDYFFGVLHSKPHELWSLRMGTWLGKGNDPRYTPTTTFETFPLPWPPGHEPGDDPRVLAIAQAAHELVEYRDNWLNPQGASESELKQRTLTRLYNERPTWLDNAHKQLDRAVFAAYGWPADLTADAILEQLLALNLERAAGQGGG